MNTPAIGAASLGAANLSTGLPDPAVNGPAATGQIPGNTGQSAGVPSTARLHGAVDTLNQMMRSLNTNVTFSVDHSTGLTVVKVVEADTGQIIRQIPSQEILSIAQALDKLQGLIIRNKA